MKKKQEGPIAAAVRSFGRCHQSFIDDMRAQKIHVGVGSPPVCATCAEWWPCSTEREARRG